MDQSNLLKLPKWPFIAGDLALFAMACWLCYQSQRPIGPWESGAIAACVLAAAVCGFLPYLLEYVAALKRMDTGALTSALTQIQQLETIAAQIGGATAQWQAAHEEAGKTVATARQLSEHMTTEMRGFTEFLEKANTAERNNLRLEVEKLRRAEAEWLQVLVRMLDHVFALHQGAVRSGQPNLIEQMGRFQNACCEAARRVGLLPFRPAPAEPFDPKRHQLLNGERQPTAEALVGDTVASGYTYQGQLLRPALVRLHAPSAGPVPAEPPSPAGTSDGETAPAQAAPAPAPVADAARVGE